MGIEQIRAMLQKPQMANWWERISRRRSNRPTRSRHSFSRRWWGYLKGMGFAFVQEQGWPMVEKLYREYLPQSTEHVLHPEKWLAREAAISKIDWVDLGKVAELRDWELLDSDVLGEFRWRVPRSKGWRVRRNPQRLAGAGSVCGVQAQGVGCDVVAAEHGMG